jgi:hypothetical protein
MYKTFYSWLFDGSKKSEIPKPKMKDDKVIIPDILKYNSPINHTFVVKLFLKNGPLNNYLDNHFNNIGLRYLDKEEFFKFIKKCVIDFKVNKKTIPYFKFNYETKLFKALRKKTPLLKHDDIYLLCDLIKKSDEKESIYQSLGLEKPTKKKSGKKEKHITLDDFLESNFSIIEMES